MIPDSVGAIVCFLLVVAPGIAYELTRQHRRPSRADSAFVEASRVVLAGVLIALTTCVVLALARACGDGVFISTLGLDRSPSHYVVGHLGRVLVTLTAYVVVSLTLATIAGEAQPYGQVRGKIVPESAWFLLLSRAVPPNVVPRVSATLADGTAYLGERDIFTSDPDLKDRELVLRPPLFVRPANAAETTPLDPAWHRVILPGDQITSLVVSYVEKEPSEADVRRLRFPRLAAAIETFITRSRRWSWGQVAAVCLAVEIAVMCVAAAVGPSSASPGRVPLRLCTATALHAPGGSTLCVPSRRGGRR